MIGRWLRRVAALGFLALAFPMVAFGGELLDAVERAPLVVVGTVESVRKLDSRGRIATIEVERGLEPKTDRTRTLQVVWEELAPSLPDRLQAGRRVLLALEPLPTASIWKRRLPEAAAREGVQHLAGAGRGFLPRPRAHTLDRLEHWLALDSRARRGDAGQLILAQLIPVADPRLAHEAIEALDTPALERAASPALTRALIAALEREEAGIGRAMAEVVERRRPPGLAAALEQRLAAHGEEASASLLYAAGALDAPIGSIAEDAPLGAEQRKALTRWRRGPGAAEALERAMIEDEDSRIRAAAVERYLELRGLDGLSQALRVFEDPEPAVRAAAVRSVAELGSDAVLPLLEFVERESGDPARAAVAALSLMGPKAQLALARLADEHEDSDIRMLAGIAVGREVGHEH